MMTLPKFCRVCDVYEKPLVGSQTLSAVPPTPFGTPFTFTLHVVWRFRSMSWKPMLGVAWLKRSKAPSRTCSFLLSACPMRKFLKRVTSKLARLGVRM